MKTLVEKYNDPNNPGLVNYLNLHHDVLAVHKFVLAEKDPRQTFVNRDVDMVSLFVSDKGFLIVSLQLVLGELSKSFMFLLVFILSKFEAFKHFKPKYIVFECKGIA